MGRENQEEKREIAEFNMSVALLKRIDLLLTNCAVASSHMDFKRWFYLLQSLSREVKYRLKDEEIEKEKQLFNICVQFHNEFCRYETRDMLSSFNGNGKFLNALDIYETFLRKCFEERGMLMINKSDVGVAMLG